LEFERAKTQWTIARWQSALLLKPHAKNGLSPRDITVFPWEQEEIALTKSEWIKQNQKIYDLCKKIR